LIEKNEEDVVQFFI